MQLIAPFRVALGLLAAAVILPAAPIQWKAADGGNDNWYEYVSTGSIFITIGFDASRAAAESSTHLGLAGYLATVTSAAEQRFIETSFAYLYGFGASTNAYLGASDAAEEGTFRWLAGPEAGQTLTYTNWWPGQPSGTGDTLALAINVAGVFSAGWIDSADGGTFGYVVEYGDGQIDEMSGVPEPGPFLLTTIGLVCLVAGSRTFRARRRV